MCLQIIAELALRFILQRPLVLLIQMALSQWLVLWAITVLIASRRELRKTCASVLITVTLLPAHLAYAAVIVLGIVPNIPTEAKCTPDQVYPLILIAPNIIFVSVYLVSIVLFCTKFCLQWGLPQSRDMPTQVKASKKKLFE